MRKTALAIALLAPALAIAADLDIGLGGMSSDKLGGRGGSKSVVAVSASACPNLCYAGRAWRVGEQMDDDIGLVPESGWSARVTTSGPYFVGARADGQLAGVVGLRADGAEIALLVPTGNARFGFAAEIATAGRTYAVLRYEYTGTQDPDTKDSLVTVGIGRRF